MNLDTILLILAVIASTIASLLLRHLQRNPAQSNALKQKAPELADGLENSRTACSEKQ